LYSNIGIKVMVRAESSETFETPTDHPTPHSPVQQCPNGRLQSASIEREYTDKRELLDDVHNR